MLTVDLHCDLLSYLLRNGAQPDNCEDIGCAFPYLKAGNVKLQVAAIYAATAENSHEKGLLQSEIFRKLISENADCYLVDKNNLPQIGTNPKIGLLASLENASAFCDETMTLKNGFENLERILENVENLLYIGLTHHAENRFGGGNFSQVGLKNDGKEVLEFLDNKNIAVDFSHTSDALAYDILDFISKQNLRIPVLASHSNYRPVLGHLRNLPDDLAQELILKQGLIGLNFIRAFVHNEDSEVLFSHIEHGLSLGAENAICYGADFYYTKSHPDQSRVPFFHPAHENASKYVELNAEIARRFGNGVAQKISSENALQFIGKVLG